MEDLTMFAKFVIYFFVGVIFGYTLFILGFLLFGCSDQGGPAVGDEVGETDLDPEDPSDTAVFNSLDRDN